jgi:hypothetical protein
MSWVAVDKDGKEFIFECCPVRGFFNQWVTAIDMRLHNPCMPIPIGSIEKLTGLKITWDSEPIELIEG